MGRQGGGLEVEGKDAEGFDGVGGEVRGESRRAAAEVGDCGEVGSWVVGERGKGGGDGVGGLGWGCRGFAFLVLAECFCLAGVFASVV